MKLWRGYEPNVNSDSKMKPETFWIILSIFAVITLAIFIILVNLT